MTSMLDWRPSLPLTYVYIYIYVCMYIPRFSLSTLEANVPTRLAPAKTPTARLSKSPAQVPAWMSSSSTEFSSSARPSDFGARGSSESAVESGGGAAIHEPLILCAILSVIITILRLTFLSFTSLFVLVLLSLRVFF